MDEDLASIVYDLRDRQQIYDCIMRYCRGMDRFDPDLAKSAYHPGALDDHGGFVGLADEFIDYAVQLHTHWHQRHQHLICNHMCTIEGDTAHTESYYICRALNREAPWDAIFSGRYIDRLEKRDGKWGIVARVCTVELRDDNSNPNGNHMDGNHLPTSRDLQDPSYMRPLVIDPARFRDGSGAH